MLKNLQREAFNWARFDTTKLSAEEIKALSVRISTQLRVTEVFLELPQRLRTLEEQQKYQEASVLKMKHSQEGGEI